MKTPRIKVSKDRVNAILLRYRGVILTDEEFKIVPEELQYVESEDETDRLIGGILLLAWARKNGIGCETNFRAPAKRGRS